MNSHFKMSSAVQYKIVFIILYDYEIKVRALQRMQLLMMSLNTNDDGISLQKFCLLTKQIGEKL